MSTINETFRQVEKVRAWSDMNYSETIVDSGKWNFIKGDGREDTFAGKNLKQQLVSNNCERTK